MLIHIIFYLCAFLFIWLGSGLIVSSLDKFSKRLRLSAFTVSFVILGLLTSIPEFAVGLTAINAGDPEIFVGNLLGGIPVIFLLIIPLLAIIGNGIELKHELDTKKMLATLGVILAPTLLVLDKRVSNPEGAILVIMYCMLLFIVQRKRGIFEIENTQLFNRKVYSPKDIVKLLGGIILVFISSHVIVDQTLYFSQVFNISAFFISLLILSFGTNLPELSLAIRSVVLGKKDVAFGDYMGSAAVNTLLFGIFTLLNHGEVLTVNNFFTTFLFIFLALVLFFLFARSKNFISRKEGFILLLVYIGFLFIEISL